MIFTELASLYQMNVIHRMNSIYCQGFFTIFFRAGKHNITVMVALICVKEFYIISISYIEIEARNPHINGICERFHKICWINFQDGFKEEDLSKLG